MFFRNNLLLLTPEQIHQLNQARLKQYVNICRQNSLDDFPDQKLTTFFLKDLINGVRLRKLHPDQPFKAEKLLHTAVLFFKRYYLFNSFVDEEPTQTAICCLYLAMKVNQYDEEFIRKSVTKWSKCRQLRPKDEYLHFDMEGYTDKQLEVLAKLEFQIGRSKLIQSLEALYMRICGKGQHPTPRDPSYLSTELLSQILSLLEAVYLSPTLLFLHDGPQLALCITLAALERSRLDIDVLGSEIKQLFDIPVKQFQITVLKESILKLPVYSQRYQLENVLKLHKLVMKVKYKRPQRAIDFYNISVLLIFGTPIHSIDKARYNRYLSTLSSVHMHRQLLYQFDLQIHKLHIQIPFKCALQLWWKRGSKKICTKKQIKVDGNQMIYDIGEKLSIMGNCYLKDNGEFQKKDTTVLVVLFLPSNVIKSGGNVLISMTDILSKTNPQSFQSIRFNQQLQGAPRQDGSTRLEFTLSAKFIRQCKQGEGADLSFHQAASGSVAGTTKSNDMTFRPSAEKGRTSNLNKSPAKDRGSSYQDGARGSLYQQAAKVNSYHDGLRGSSYQDGFKSNAFNQTAKGSNYQQTPINKLPQGQQSSRKPKDKQNIYTQHARNHQLQAQQQQNLIINRLASPMSSFGDPKDYARPQSIQQYRLSSQQGSNRGEFFMNQYQSVGGGSGLSGSLASGNINNGRQQQQKQQQQQQKQQQQQPHLSTGSSSQSDPFKAHISQIGLKPRESNNYDTMETGKLAVSPMPKQPQQQYDLKKYQTVKASPTFNQRPYDQPVQVKSPKNTDDRPLEFSFNPQGLTPQIAKERRQLYNTIGELKKELTQRNRQIEQLKFNNGGSSNQNGQNYSPQQNQLRGKYETLLERYEAKKNVYEELQKTHQDLEDAARRMKEELFKKDAQSIGIQKQTAARIKALEQEIERQRSNSSNRSNGKQDYESLLSNHNALIQRYGALESKHRQQSDIIKQIEEQLTSHNSEQDQQMMALRQRYAALCRVVDQHAAKEDSNKKTIDDYRLKMNQLKQNLQQKTDFIEKARVYIQEKQQQILQRDEFIQKAKDYVTTREQEFQKKGQEIQARQLRSKQREAKLLQLQSQTQAQQQQTQANDNRALHEMQRMLHEKQSQLAAFKAQYNSKSERIDELEGYIDEMQQRMEVLRQEHEEMSRKAKYQQETLEEMIRKNLDMEIEINFKNCQLAAWKGNGQSAK